MSERKCERVGELDSQEESKKAVAKAMSLLLQQDRTYNELQERLCRVGFSEQAVESAMSYVMSYGYIDDYRYASNYILFHKKSRSRKELWHKLKNKGIESDILTQVFEEYESSDEEEAIHNCLTKRLKSKRVSDLSYEEQNKVIGYLARKGYALPAIKRVMRAFKEYESSENL